MAQQFLGFFLFDSAVEDVRKKKKVAHHSICASKDDDAKNSIMKTLSFLLCARVDNKMFFFLLFRTRIKDSHHRHVE